MIFVLVVLLFAIYLLHCHFKQRKVYNEVIGIPGPKILPLIGNVLDVGTNTVDILINLKGLVKQYGPIFRLCVGSQIYIVLSEPRYINQVLTSNELADKSDLYDLFKCLVGEGIGTTTTGERWARHRRILSATFAKKYLVNYMGIFNKNSKTFVQELKGFVGKSSVDIVEHVVKLGLNNVLNTTMSVEITASTEYNEALGNALRLLINRLFSPIGRCDFIYQFTRDYSLLQKNIKIMKDFCKYVIAQRKSTLLVKGKDATLSLIDYLLYLPEAEAFSEEEIMDEVQTFIGAGSDTITSALSFGIFELAKHPGIQTKILEETNYVLGTDKNADISYQNAKDLQYTDRVFKEILRCYPTAPFLMRTLLKEMSFGGHVVPVGTNIMIFFAGMYMTAEYFPNPEKFNPNRFLEENMANQSRFMPFGAGSRVCLGLRYAELEAKVVLAKLIRNYEILPVHPEHNPILVAAGILQSENGLPVRLRAR